MQSFIVEKIEFDFTDSMGTITEQEQEFITDNALGLWHVDSEWLDPEEALIMNKQPMYIKGDIALIAKYNRFDESVEIGDLNNASDGWVTYDPTQGASSDELTEICNSLYDRCLLAELGIKGFTPAGEQHLIKS